MTSNRIIQPGQSYTFSKYFELPYTTKDILADFDCSYEKKILELPNYLGEITYLEFLKRYLQRNISIFDSVAEIAIREMLISPILVEICDQTQSILYIEYSVNVNEQLKGTFDYYLVSQNSLLVIEAKQSDLKRGFNQLAIELLALDQWVDSPNAILYGAVTNGYNWKFGILQRQEKHIIEDTKLYRVPEGLEELVRVLVGILSNPNLSR
ncbi:hypothetical protein H1Q63_25210 [Desmonostoc muscorum CCALA 125]|uniref:hypothetical protein n=1 Tax=Desmonostoc muscorum TaxID=1179 RepID=UPI001C8BE576|nr:hypothetical protein [Desmonostoc muscorum]MBX9257184.1 hypothetical protein [Desmonostoc muscorum CCALA 125]MCF2146342.1 hypothetical protein [Desmonostoc muscorum LEGE 12446]